MAGNQGRTKSGLRHISSIAASRLDARSQNCEVVKIGINERIEEIEQMTRYVPHELQAHHGQPYMRSYIKGYIINFYQRETETLAERALVWEQKNRKELHK
jgi:hypothetical protein